MPKEIKDLKIGLEIHGYLQTKEKLFCRCPASRHSKIKENTNICPICTGQPGSKPMLPNSEAINKLIQIALILGCKINSSFSWQRKHYDWPDLPKGYQNTISGSYSIPVGESGKFDNIGITEVHLEEDPAAWNPETGCIDYNRSGLPLVEIVTEPDFSSSEQVEFWLNKLILALSYIKAVDSNAGIKVDVNISLGKEKGKERVEVKNMTSIEDIKNAIKVEIARQEVEGTLRETRRYDSSKGITIRMRGKEDAADYRFIPEPDLPVIKLEKSRIIKIQQHLPETPEQKLSKLVQKHKIDKRSAEVLYKNFELVEFFEKVSLSIPADFALPWVTIELLRVLNYNRKKLEEVDIKPEHFIKLLELVRQKKITELKAKQILNEFVPKSFEVKLEKEEERITDKKELEKFCLQAINKNPQAKQDFRSGKKESINFLLGEVMKLSNKRADFKTAREVLESLLRA